MKTATKRYLFQLFMLVPALMLGIAIMVGRGFDLRFTSGTGVSKLEIPRLQKVASEPAKGGAFQQVQALMGLEESHPPTIAPTSVRFESYGSDVEAWARALAHSKMAASADALLEAVSRDDDEGAEIEAAREAAEAALEDLDDPSLAPVYRDRAYNHPDAMARMMAARVTARLDPLGAPSLWRDIASRDSDSAVRSFALGQASILRDEELLARAQKQDPSPEVRQTASLLLTQVR